MKSKRARTKDNGQELYAAVNRVIAESDALDMSDVVYQRLSDALDTYVALEMSEQTGIGTSPGIAETRIGFAVETVRYAMVAAFAIVVGVILASLLR